MAVRKIAVVGIGKIARDKHLPVISGNPDFALAALVSQRGQGFGDLPVFRTPAELYAARPDIEVVAFCTPPSVRHDMVREAFEAGKHALIEKPPTPTLSALLSLEAFAKQHGRVLFATWHSQFNPSIARVRSLIAADGLRRASIDWRESVWRWHPGQDWIWEPGGFGVFDPGINALSILTAIMPGVVGVRSADLEVPKGRQTPIAARLSLEALDAPIEARFDWRERTNEVWDIVVETGKGQILEMSRGGGELRIDGEVVFALPKFEYERIYERFAELLDAGTSEVDAAPLRLVADCFLAARRSETGPFTW